MLPEGNRSRASIRFEVQLVPRSVIEANVILTITHIMIVALIVAHQSRTLINHCVGSGIPDLKFHQNRAIRFYMPSVAFPSARSTLWLYNILQTNIFSK